MIQAGMDVCRLNFSHGDHASHQVIFDRVRQLSAKYNNSVAILCDVQGPKIRTGIMEAPFTISYGDTIRVTPKEIVGTPERIQIKYDTLLEDLDTDDIIFINDGIVKLVVQEKDMDAGDLICVCEAPGDISNHKGCNMPSGKLSVNVVTPKDANDLKFIAQLDPEYVAASFVGTGDDIVQVRKELEKHGNFDIKIVAKVERPVALENIDDIIRESDALMVARGDLGVEIEAWDVPKCESARFDITSLVLVFAHIGHLSPYCTRTCRAKGNHSSLQQGEQARDCGHANDGEHDSKQSSNEGGSK
jgi:pyruvate kinase